MFGRALVALLVVGFVWLAVRAPLLPVGVPRSLACALVSVMVPGGALYLCQGWDQGREIVRVRTANVLTGQSVTYSARRRDRAGRCFRTPEGHSIVLVDVDRMKVHKGQEAVERAQPFGSDSH
jgi:hypothetical protein